MQNIFKIAEWKEAIEVNALFNPFIPDVFSFDKGQYYIAITRKSKNNGNITF